MNYEFSGRAIGGTVSGLDNVNGWLFAQAVLGNDVSNDRCVEAGRPAASANLGWLGNVSTEHARKFRELAAEEAEKRCRHELLEWVGQVLSLPEEWDPEKHPRGGYPENRGEFSPTWGTIAGSLGTALAAAAGAVMAEPSGTTEKESPDAKAPWYDTNKNASDVATKIEGRAATIHFENTTQEYRDKLTEVVKKAFAAANAINEELKNGKLTKDSPAIKFFFGDLTDKQFDRVKQVFSKVVDAPNHEGALKIRSEAQGEPGLVAKNDVIGIGIPDKPDLQIGKRSTRITLLPPFFQKQPDDQIARYFHELTHEGGNTKDYGYWDDRQHVYTDRKGKQVDLTTEQKVNNANNYERFLRSRLGQ